MKTQISHNALKRAALLPMLCVPILSLRTVAVSQTVASPPISGMDTACQVVENPPKEKPIQWGKKVQGFQLGTRIVQEGSTFKAGDVIKFQAFGRNLSGKDARLSVGNFWKVNYELQIQTRDGKPIYMKRDERNRPMEVAGYRAETLGNGITQEMPEAMLKIEPASLAPKPGTTEGEEDNWVEAVSLRPGRYRVRLLSRGLFGTHNPEPASDWIPIQIAAN